MLNDRRKNSSGTHFSINSPRLRFFLYCLVALEAAQWEFGPRISILKWFWTWWTHTFLPWRGVTAKIHMKLTINNVLGFILYKHMTTLKGYTKTNMSIFLCEKDRNIPARPWFKNVWQADIIRKSHNCSSGTNHPSNSIKCKCGSICIPLLHQQKYIRNKIGHVEVEKREGVGNRSKWLRIKTYNIVQAKTGQIWLRWPETLCVITCFNHTYRKKNIILQ